ncbi:MAG TPA: glycosyltransferase family 2 protein [Bacteroidales bacterium]|nr:glycosyltransferase family 2 protein [Bacteroidales bacterium]
MGPFMQSNPLVTVNILSYNRCDELKHTLTKVYEQDYKNIEVIVVDNASCDGSPEMVKRKFPNVNLIQLKENIGAPGFNCGFEAANGEYVLILDDDSYPDNVALSSAVKFLQQNKDYDIIAFNIFNKYEKRYEQNYFVNEIPYSFIGCGALISKYLLKDIGGYNELYFLYHNELDFSATAIAKGYKIAFLKNAIIYHSFNSQNRGFGNNLYVTPKRYYFFSISYYNFIFTKFSGHILMKMFWKLFINRTLIAFNKRYFKEYIKLYHYVITKTPNIKKKRMSLPRNLQNQYSFILSYVDRTYFPNFSKPYIFKIFEKS